MENLSYTSCTSPSFICGEWLHNPALSLWLSVDPLSDKYPGVSPYVYCGNNPVMMKDPDGRDWYEPDEGGVAIWRKGNAKTLSEKGISYHNVGRYYTKVNGDILTHYDQNNVLGETNLRTDIGKKFSMIAAEGGWVKDENGKTVRETQYGLYIIGASMENRLNHSRFFPNNGTYQTLFDPKQYNAANSSTYKNLASRINQWKQWYGTKSVMEYLNAVYNAAHGNCVAILTKQYDFTNANMILGYAHSKTSLFGKYTINLDFHKEKTLIKVVQSSSNIFPQK